MSEEKPADEPAPLTVKQQIADLCAGTDRPEPERRAALLLLLIDDGYVIQKQESGLVVAVMPKPGFSLILFLVLCLLWVMPGLLYLLWWATQRDETRQFILAASPGGKRGEGPWH